MSSDPYDTGAVYVALRSWAESRGPLEQALASYGEVHGEESPKLLPVVDQLRDVYQGLAVVPGVMEPLRHRRQVVEPDLSIRSTAGSGSRCDARPARANRLRQPRCSREGAVASL